MVKTPPLSKNGDNFVHVGPWRILRGEAWRRWRAAAAEAELQAALNAGDEAVAQRLRRRLAETAGSSDGAIDR